MFRPILRAGRSADDLLDRAENNRLTVYDAAYLEVATRGGCELASLDESLNAAATKAGVVLFDPAEQR